MGRFVGRDILFGFKIANCRVIFGYKIKIKYHSSATAAERGIKKRENIFLTQRRKGRKGRSFCYWYREDLLKEVLCLDSRLQTVRCF